MAEVTYFVALPLITTNDAIPAGEPTECFNPIAVVMRAEALVRSPSAAPVSDAKVIRKFGDVPDDLCAL
jgi:hypothetical protein